MWTAGPPGRRCARCHGYDGRGRVCAACLDSGLPIDEGLADATTERARALLAAPHAAPLLAGLGAKAAHPEVSLWRVDLGALARAVQQASA